MSKIVWSIAIVAENTGLHPQTIRTWERVGLISPMRTQGGARRFDADLLERLRHIQTLMNLGMSLDAVRYVLQLEAELVRLQNKLGGN